MNNVPGTFDLDKTLSPLPVPSLAETCARYLASIEPLVCAEDFQRIMAKVEDLQVPGGVGERLQTALEQRAAGMDNWLLNWWASAAYLDWPQSLVCNSSIGISSDARVAPGDQAMRAAQVTAEALRFYLAIVNETLPPETQRDGSPLDMSLMRKFYATTRFPGTQGDKISTYGLDEARHIIVIRRGHIFQIDVIDPDGRLVQDGDLVILFRQVIAKADAAGAATPVAALTATARPDWANVRDQLTLDPTNRGNLDRIDRAICVVCLDADNHSSFDQLARAGLYGQPGNRWHDKSVHLVIDADGRFTLHGEHTPVDAGAWVPLVDMVSLSPDPLPAQNSAAAPEPQPLMWNLGPDVVKAIEAAVAHVEKITNDLDLHIAHFNTFGKTVIKTLKTGPDPVLQVAFQLAYWRLYQRSPKVYEAASTRMYRGGRTETIRSTSNESRAFVMAMDDEGVPDSQKSAMLREAFIVHNTRVKEASAGFGVDRHMLGLQLIASELGVTDLPEIYSEPVHTRGWELSTAQLPMRDGFVNHFAPVCPEGYGIGYVIKNDHINMCVTAWKSHPETDAGEFAKAISTALNDLRALLERADGTA